MIAGQQQPFRSTRDEPTLWFLGLPTLVRAGQETTNSAFGLIENWNMAPGFASPYHTHHNEDESFYVIEGEMEFVCGGKWLTAGPGTYIFGPREVPHGFRVIGNTPARLLLLCSPGGFERFVLDMSESAPAPPDMGKLMAIAAKYNIDILGPLPEKA